MLQSGGATIGSSARAEGATLPEMLTPKVVAETLHVSEREVLELIAAGELRAKKIGASYRIKRSDLEAFLSN